MRIIGMRYLQEKNHVTADDIASAIVGGSDLTFQKLKNHLENESGQMLQMLVEHPFPNPPEWMDVPFVTKYRNANEN